MRSDHFSRARVTALPADSQRATFTPPGSPRFVTIKKEDSIKPAQIFKALEIAVARDDCVIEVAKMPFLEVDNTKDCSL